MDPSQADSGTWTMSERGRMTGSQQHGSVAASQLGRGGGQDAERIRILPDLNIVKIGGASIIEAGRAIVYPLIEEIAAASRQFQLVITCGGGARHRHVFTVGVDLAMPVGVLAKMGGNAPFQNALVVQALLAKHGGIRVAATQFEEVPLYLAAGSIPVMSGMPTYDYWEHPPAKGVLPVHDTDVGAHLLAETFGARSVIFATDVDGVYTADPKVKVGAERLPHVVTTDELRELTALPFDPPVLEMLDRARIARRVQVIDGRIPGHLTAALKGEAVGTIVRAS